MDYLYIHKQNLAFIVCAWFHLLRGSNELQHSIWKRERAANSINQVKRITYWKHIHTILNSIWFIALCLSGCMANSPTLHFNYLKIYNNITWFQMLLKWTRLTDAWCCCSAIKIQSNDCCHCSSTTPFEGIYLRTFRSKVSWTWMQQTIIIELV